MEVYVQLIKSLNGWIFYDPSDNELNENYPKRTLAMNMTKMFGTFVIVCYDFPKGKDIRVEVHNIDVSGPLINLDEAFEFVKNFKERNHFDELSMFEGSFGSGTDMEILLDVNQSGDITRNGKMFEFQKSLHLK